MDWYGITVLCITSYGLIAAVAYVVDYWRLSRYSKKSEYWWLFMAWPLSTAALFGYVIFARLFGENIVRRLVGVFFWAALTLMVPWLHRLMRRSMKSGSLREKQIRNSPKGDA